MKITIAILAKLEASSIADAIEKIAADHETIASGTCGPAFSTSGPGSGWSRHHDCNDFADYALSESYGALRYIDSADGREATRTGPRDEDGFRTIEWSEESVVEIELPTVEEALEHPEQWALIADRAAHYGADQEKIDELAEKIAEPYQIKDSGGVTEYATSLEHAACLIEDWYDHLVDDGKLDEIPTPDLDTDSLADLSVSVIRWEEEIAAAMGAESFSGHGRYHVSAADRAGLSLSISVRD